jgi:hypothetical protein
MQYHPRFQDLLRDITVSRIAVALGYFGAPSEKYIFLYSNRPALLDVARRSSQGWLPSSRHLNIVRTYAGADGTMKFDGGSGMKESQTYPEFFGIAVAASFHEHQASLINDGQNVVNAGELAKPATLDVVWGGDLGDDWSDALLQPSFDVLALRVPRG